MGRGLRDTTLVCLLTAAAAFGQGASDLQRPATRQGPSRPREIPNPAHISGIVLTTDGQPLRRARVNLTAHTPGSTPTSVETDDTGKFTLGSLQPGVYSMTAVRDGYLPADFAYRGTIRMPRQFGIYPDQKWTDVVFRLIRWGVISGAVKYGDDAEPAMRVPVLAYRKRYSHGRMEYQLAGSGRSDDRGEYRIAGLAPGSYIIGAIYDKPKKPAGTEATSPEQQAIEIADAPASEPSYASNFFTSAMRVTDAALLDVGPGQEQTGVELNLHVTRSTRLRGTVTDGCTGLPTQANLEVYRAGEDDATAIPANVDSVVSPTGFVIRGLSPGTYVLTGFKQATTNCPSRSYRRVFQVSEEPYDNLEVVLRPFESTKLRLTFDTKERMDPTRYRFRLYPKLNARSSVVTVSFDRRGVGEAMLDVNEIYTVVMDEGPIDHYLQGPLEISGNGGTIPVAIGTRGAKVVGMVVDEKAKAVPGATVTMIPESSGRLAQPFFQGFAELDGSTLVRGIAPGRYVAVPWLDKPPCEMHSPDAFRNCQSAGASVSVKENEEQVVELKLRLN